MIDSKKGLMWSLGIPILALAALVLYKKHHLETGIDVTLPVLGYDPRDLLSGHYLIYTVDYGLPKICDGNKSAIKRDAYVCLEPRFFSFEKPKNCPLFIKGGCRYTRFEAGVERYFVPETEAKRLEQHLLDKKASITLTVNPQGNALIKDFLIEGVRWQELPTDKQL